jgi:hypothetical protein
MPGLPVVEIVMPAVLVGQMNGQLDDAVLVDIGGGQRLAQNAALSWIAMAAAASDDGVQLEAGEGFRDLDRQIWFFEDRWVLVRPAKSKATTVWDGKQWWLPEGAVSAAYPGHSNHGWGLAVDVLLRPGVLGWLIAHAHLYGWSWEAGINIEEPWHIHFFAGDEILPAVAARIPQIIEPPVTEEELVLQIMRIPGCTAIFEGLVTKLPDGLPVVVHCTWISNGDRVADLEAHGVPSVDYTLGDMRRITLLGPIPNGDVRPWTADDFLVVV